MPLSLINSVGLNLQDRGDPAAYDVTEATLAMDGAWHDLDLSAIVPAGSTWIMLRVVLNDANVGDSLHFRKNGNANVIAAPGIIAQVTSQDIETIIIVPCDTGQVIEYMANAALDSVDIVVLGYI